jgi:hypothetical protein
MENRTILDSVSYSPGYVTKDGKWAAVPLGSQFMILNEGNQLDVFPTIEEAKDFIAKKVKATTGVSGTKNPKKLKSTSKGTLNQFIK